MPDIQHRVCISAPLKEVYNAVATTDGLSHWWTLDGVRGDASVGSNLEFYFASPEPSAIMEIEALDETGHVQWLCVGGAMDWIGTKISFDLSLSEGQTAVLFTHGGWRQSSEFMAHCSARWSYFLLSLKSLVETGKGTPFPEDLKF